jgi:hypothetical protein
MSRHPKTFHRRRRPFATVKRTVEERPLFGPNEKGAILGRASIPAQY